MDADPRFWLIAPSHEDITADPNAELGWRLVDEEAGGTVAYFLSYELAERVASALNEGECSR